MRYIWSCKRIARPQCYFVGVNKKMACGRQGHAPCGGVLLNLNL